MLPGWPALCLVCQRVRGCLAYIRKACASEAGTQTDKDQASLTLVHISEIGLRSCGHVLASREVTVASLWLFSFL